MFPKKCIIRSLLIFSSLSRSWLICASHSLIVRRFARICRWLIVNTCSYRRLLIPVCKTFLLFAICNAISKWGWLKGEKQPNWVCRKRSQTIGPLPLPVFLTLCNLLQNYFPPEASLTYILKLTYVRSLWPMQSPKNLGCVSALLTGKFLRVRKVFARIYKIGH